MDGMNRVPIIFNLLLLKREANHAAAAEVMLRITVHVACGVRPGRELLAQELRIEQGVARARVQLVEATKIERSD